jgi:hydrogenase nickel incorporation protein HypA/HybF
MHEVGLVTAALEQAERAARQAGAVRIERVTFAIVAGGHVTREAVEMIFAALSRGTLAEGAAVVVVEQAASWACVGCARSFVVSKADGGSTPVACPSCGAPGIPDTRLPELSFLSMDVAD